MKIKSDILKNLYLKIFMIQGNMLSNLKISLFSGPQLINIIRILLVCMGEW